MTKRDREDFIERRAFELAETGQYRDYRDVEMVLRSEGYPEARTVLDNSFLREQIKKVCKGKDRYA